MAEQNLPSDLAFLKLNLPTASVALATYNGATFIRAQLDSILAQTELPHEIVVTDDQSSDGTLDIIADYAAHSPIPIRTHRNAERLGFQRNFRKAAGLCRSDLIFFCDQDDVWEPNKVERMKRVFADPSVFLAYHGALVITEQDEPLYPFLHAGEQLARLAAKPIEPWHASYGLTQVFRASLRNHDDLWDRAINHICGENEPLAHDQWYYLLAQIFGRVAYVDEPLVRYRQHGSNAVGAAQSNQNGGIWARLRQQLDHDPRMDRLKADAALRRVEILTEIACRTDGAVAERAQIVAAHYSDLAERLMRRRSAYVSASPWQRAASLGRMLRNSDYGAHPWRFRKRSILRDVIRGVLGNAMGSEPVAPHRPAIASRGQSAQEAIG